jgi:hypothetical protein
VNASTDLLDLDQEFQENHNTILVRKTAYVFARMCPCTYIARIYTRMYLRIFVCAHVKVCARVLMSVYMYACSHMFIHAKEIYVCVHAKYLCVSELFSHCKHAGTILSAVPQCVQVSGGPSKVH